MKYFKRKEFICPCCGKEWMDLFTLAKFDHARELAGIPFVVTSGCRCEVTNRAVGGAEDSAHLYGRAGDFKAASSYDRFLIVRGLILAGITRIGIYAGHVHGDDNPNAAQEVIWISGRR